MNSIIAALDVPERARTLELARLLAPEVGMVKLGLESFVAHGPDLVREVRALGVDVFLDLKLHDIPRTAAAAAREAAKLDVRLLTIHASGGAEMISACREAVGVELTIVAVTVLTSLADDDVRDVGFSDATTGLTERLGKLAMSNGAHGLVCSAHDLSALASAGGIRVVPGIRPAAHANHDQKRVATPGEARAAGATWLVVGRPIVDARDPVAAARAIAAEVQ
ncbi:MAG: orotidine-5'-phosphate decarboxylase [Clostridia bacterium]|nr:orotidine-5'-phosphate decarboxylase [Deltaproteobacteria bacterium]